MSFSLDIFSNDKYQILKLISDNHIQIKNEIYTPLSQQEIADLAHMSKLKTNKILNELKTGGFIDYYKGKRGKYVVTDDGKTVIDIISQKY